MIMPRASTDIRDGFKDRKVWVHLAYLDLKMRYRRTVIGPFWAVLSSLIFILSLGFVYSVLWKAELGNFLPYFSAGYITWVFISSNIEEAGHVYSSHADLIRSTGKPLSTHIYRLIAKNILVLFHMIPVQILVMLYFGHSISLVNLLQFAIGLVMLTTVLFFIVLILSTIITRYHDVAQIVTSIMQFSFFLTPIVWKVDAIGPDKTIFSIPLVTIIGYLNPFYNMLELVRAPMVGSSPSLHSYIYVIVLTAILAFVAMTMFNKYKPRIAFWI